MIFRHQLFYVEGGKRGGYCAGIFLRIKNSMLVKKIFYSPQCPRIRF
jgi:hypothetical protein